MNHFFHTIDIRLAACLDSMGIPFRKVDPVTKVEQIRNGKTFEQCTFWFDTTDDVQRQNCAILERAYETAKPLFKWKRDVRLDKADANFPPKGDHYELGEEHPLYYEMDALFLREVWLDWLRNGADTRKIIQEGKKTVNISTRASQATKDLIKKYL